LKRPQWPAQARIELRGAETHEAWLEDNRYINMELLKEQKKAAMKIAA
jgi:hypothetical protein